MKISKTYPIDHEDMDGWWFQNVIQSFNEDKRKKCYDALKKYKPDTEGWVSFYDKTINKLFFKNISIQQIQKLYKELISF